MKACFSTAYLPNVAWFREALKHKSILIETQESWQKQSYRNRTYILGPNGPLMLNIPIDHNTTKGSIDQVEISYTGNWQHRHWQAILSAYGSAPFFESLALELEPFYKIKTERLLDFNNKILHLILSWLQSDLGLESTTEWQADRDLDLRGQFHPKNKTEPQLPYPQVFEEKQGFISNLSVIDLIFNEGRSAYDYLVG